MTTIRDVADHAGVSIATVSRLLTKPDTVAPDTRERVQASIDALGYEPHFAATSLRKGRASRLLVTVPDISNPFFASVIRGAEDAASEAGFSIVLGDTRYQAEREEQYALMLRRREVDGLIFLGHTLPRSLMAMLKAKPNAPIVNGCEYSPELPVSSVHIDNRRAAKDGMEYLYAIGHRHIAVITGPLASPISRDRLEGVREVAEAAGSTKQLRVAVADFSIEAAAREARRLLASGTRPTAIFCFSDGMAMGAISAIRSFGLDCPTDISLMGFDDLLFAKFSHPALTTISQPTETIGMETVRLLLGMLDGTIASKMSITLPHQLVIRASTQPCHR